jgi:phospholipase C
MARINHFIVLMLENRSFDHMFGFLPPPDGEKIENTFEVVQYRGAEITAEVIGLLDSLRQQIPRLRAVISGRAPVNTPDYPKENKPLEKLNVKDAAALLTRQGVPPQVASKVAVQVGGSPLSLRLAIEV